MKIFFSVGEPSGDLHAANLIRQLRSQHPELEAVGYGGPQMAAAGCQLHADLTALAVMWFLRVLLNLHKFLALAGRADRYFRHSRPDAVVLIDYPGFNWWIARRAKAHGIPVFYYVPPQIWAWASWRVKKMRRLVDHVLCSLPFEVAWYGERGCRATFVGHPYFDEVSTRPLDHKFVATQQREDSPLVTILPGSRTQEVKLNLKYFLEAAALVHAQLPHVRFAIASFRPMQAELARTLAAASGLPIEVHLRRTPELIEAADCCLAVSGSVSLELLYHTRPTAILYWISPLAYRVQLWFRHTRYITLVNLLTAKQVFSHDLSPYDPAAPKDATVLFPEYLTCENKSRALADHVIRWLTDRAERARVTAELAALKERVGHGGASRRASEYILTTLGAKRPPIPRPHFRPLPAPVAEAGGDAQHAA
ncbi:MAG TPA: lipid-A-disaccharide synthase [Pirellulales bacterium]|nr:lipid-A-disaccharide synthase [Pirellulales bacterium]